MEHAAGVARSGPDRSLPCLERIFPVRKVVTLIEGRNG